ncbi:hypothetical protein CBM2634_B140041 [Cupriavidus taiwanensis]|uniref:Uncharacterized protein n=1 Tax=Cupriavidus taiwanensis TaxID=164546 RepID=A0A375J5C8_9BURK|nr:hypothetical protein CBM2634_B140041 [Cupriavidus taiwanensis]
MHGAGLRSAADAGAWLALALGRYNLYLRRPIVSKNRFPSAVKRACQHPDFDLSRRTSWCSTSASMSAGSS